MTLTVLLLVFAFVLFVIAASGVNSGRWNLIAAGLAFATLSVLLDSLSAVTV